MTRLAAVAALLVSASLAQNRDRLRPLPPASKDAKTGPAVGGRIPDFRLPDQTGVERDFASLRGPKGLVLAFVRSADW